METNNEFSQDTIYRKSIPFECKSLDVTSGELQGYGSVFNVVDYYEERVMPGAFKDSLQQHANEKTYPAMLRDHDTTKVVGVYTGITEDAVGLQVTGKFAMDVQVGKETYSIVKMYHDNGQSFGLSIGYRVLEWKEDPTSRKVINLTKLDLREVSLVPFPALRVARTTGVKFESEVPTEREFEKLLREAGFSRNQAREVCDHGYKSLLRPKYDSFADVVEALNNLKTIMKGNV